MNSKLYLGISASKHLGFVQFLTGGFHPAISINERNNQSNLSLQFFYFDLERVTNWSENQTEESNST
jgi:hypothetical protein